jgi:hypothetical protein
MRSTCLAFKLNPLLPPSPSPPPHHAEFAYCLLCSPLLTPSLPPSLATEKLARPAVACKPRSALLPPAAGSQRARRNTQAEQRCLFGCCCCWRARDPIQGTREEERAVAVQERWCSSASWWTSGGRCGAASRRRGSARAAAGAPAWRTWRPPPGSATCSPCTGAPGAPSSAPSAAPCSSPTATTGYSTGSGTALPTGRRWSRSVDRAPFSAASDPGFFFCSCLIMLGFAGYCNGTMAACRCINMEWES